MMIVTKIITEDSTLDVTVILTLSLMVTSKH